MTKRLANQLKRSRSAASTVVSKIEPIAQLIREFGDHEHPKRERDKLLHVLQSSSTTMVSCDLRKSRDAREVGIGSARYSSSEEIWSDDQIQLVVLNV
ncbi:MAG TPA: hypothetical protein VIS72_18140 [Anaerolineales bacterium]